MQSRDKQRSIDYITQTFVQEPEYLKPIRARGETIRPGMQLSPYEGYLLRWLVRMRGAASILEIGTFIGYSALWMASGLPEHGRITTLEHQPNQAEIAAQHFAESPHTNQIELVRGDALQWLAKQAAQPTYDFVFIDAAKRRYLEYLHAVLPLLKSGAWIVADNTLLWGAVSGEQPDAATPEMVAVMQQFNRALADETRFETVLLPTPEGLTVARLR